MKVISEEASLRQSNSNQYSGYQQHSKPLIDHNSLNQIYRTQNTMITHHSNLLKSTQEDITEKTEKTRSIGSRNFKNQDILTPLQERTNEDDPIDPKSKVNQVNKNAKNDFKITDILDQNHIIEILDVETLHKGQIPSQVSDGVKSSINILKINKDATSI